MKTLSKPLPESTGAYSFNPVSNEGQALDAHRAPALAGLPALPAPTVSRRSMTAMLLAAFAPAAGTAAVLPKVVETAAAALQPPAAPPVLAGTGPFAEDPTLLALGAELEDRIAAFRAAAAGLAPARAPSAAAPTLLARGAELADRIAAFRAAAAGLAQARATAVKLWPAIPDEIVAASAEDRRRFRGYTYEELDHDGNEVWPPSFWRDGKEFSPGPKRILSAVLLSGYLDEVRAEPDAFADWVEPDLVRRIELADRYELDRFEATEASGIEEAKRQAERCADALYDLMWEVRERTPRTLAGVLIFAGAMAAFEEARPESRFKGEGIGGTVLGRGLADAVLRVAGITA